MAAFDPTDEDGVALPSPSEQPSRDGGKALALDPGAAMLHPQTTRGGRVFMGSGDRLLTILWLFSAERPVLTAEEIAKTLHISLSTAYRYLGQLSEAGLVTSAGPMGHTLGPAIIELDRQIRLADPLVQSASPVLRRLLDDVSSPLATILLCRLYRNRVMCVAQTVGSQAQEHVSYERGRLMPILRGAPSKAILAHLPSRAAERLWEEQKGETSGMPLDDWKGYRQQLNKLRKAGVAVCFGEVDPGMVGIAAPIFDPQGRPIGSICTVLPEHAAPPPTIARASTLTRASADEIAAVLVEREMARDSGY
jgi:DNA-binding IclR family transcriptional regulator